MSHEPECPCFPDLEHKECACDVARAAYQRGFMAGHNFVTELWQPTAELLKEKFAECRNEYQRGREDASNAAMDAFEDMYGGLDATRMQIVAAALMDMPPFRNALGDAARGDGEQA